MRNYVQVTDQPQCFNKTCINMLSVGVCDSTSVHTLTFLAGSKDICLYHPEICNLKQPCELHTNNRFYFPNNFHLFSWVMMYNQYLIQNQSDSALSTVSWYYLTEMMQRWTVLAHYRTTESCVEKTSCEVIYTIVWVNTRFWLVAVCVH